MSKMRDPARIDEVLEALREAWVKVPDWRLTQLVINASDTNHDCGPVFYLEDSDLLARLQRLSTSIDNPSVQSGSNTK
jgi:uncharacterized protein YihD (DUF1040 family)